MSGRTTPGPDDDVGRTGRRALLVLGDRLRSGRALVAAVLPTLPVVVLGWLSTAWSSWDGRPLAVEPGAVHAPVLVLGAALVALSLTAGVVGAGAALEQITHECQGRRTAIFGSLAWPVRRPWLLLGSVLAAAATVVVAAAAALVAGLAMARIATAAFWLVVAPVLAMSVVVRVTAPMWRWFAARLLLGSVRAPGVVTGADRVPGRGRSSSTVMLVATLLLGGAAGTWALLPTSDLDWVSSTAGLVGESAVVLTGLVIVAAVAGDVLPASVPRVPSCGIGRGRRRHWACWFAGTVVAVVPVLAADLLVQVNPWGLTSYEVSTLSPWSQGAVRLSVGGGNAYVADLYAAAGCTGGCRWWGDRLPRSGAALSEDGSTLWFARWEDDAQDGTVDPFDVPMTLTLRPVSMSAQMRYAGHRDVEPPWLVASSQDLVVTQDRSSVLHPGRQTNEYQADVPVAVAVQGDRIAVATSYLADQDDPGDPDSRSRTGPMVLARCTSQGCETMRTEHVLGSWTLFVPQLDVALAADGTVYATAYGSSPGPDGNGGLQLVIGATDGSVQVRQILPPTDEYRVEPDGAGAAIEVAEDGTVWIAYRWGEDDPGRLFRCRDVRCSGWDELPTGVVQSPAAFTVDGTGRPMAGWIDDVSGTVSLRSCRDTACSAVDEVVLARGSGGGLPESAWDGPTAALTLDDGRPVIAVIDRWRLVGGSSLYHCADARCHAP